MGGKEPIAVEREIEALEVLKGCPEILQYHGVYRNVRNYMRGVCFENA